MSIPLVVPEFPPPTAREAARQHFRGKSYPFAAVPFPARPTAEEPSSRHAELFYLQKQIHSQTPMVVVLEDGERIEGIIEWYDRNTLKLRGRQKTLVYKSAIKYMYKLSDGGQ